MKRHRLQSDEALEQVTRVRFSFDPERCFHQSWCCRIELVTQGVNGSMQRKLSLIRIMR
jgi:hypothetical protein